MEHLINTITEGDSFELIRQIDDESIDFVLTDPPYFLEGTKGFKGKDWDSSKSLIDSETVAQIESGLLKKKEQKIIYQEAVDKYFDNMTKQLLPKLKKDGAIIAFNRMRNLKTIQLVLENDKLSISTFPENKSRWYITFLEWKKTNPNHYIAELDSSEYALIAINMTKSSDKIGQIPDYWDDAVNSDNQYFMTSPANKNTVFYESSNHVSPKPIPLWSDLIRRFTQPGDLVLDIFSGSGTTAFVAEDLGRNFIAFEFENEQVKNSLERLKFFREKMPYSAFPFEE